MIKFKIIPYCKENGHKFDPYGYCVYCNRSKARLQTNNKNFKEFKGGAK